MELENIKLEFTDEQMNKLIKRLQELFNHQQTDFANLCQTVYQISQWFVENKDCVLRMRKTSTYYNEKDLFKSLGIKNREKQKYIQCYKKYMTPDENCADVGAKIAEPFVSFTPSKLFELLPISTEKLIEFIQNKQITPDMTVKQLRDFFAVSERNEMLAELSEDEVDDYYVGDFEEDFIILKNDTARKDFIENFRTWGIWFEEQRLGLKYYRVKIKGKILVAILSKYKIPTGETMDEVRYHYMNELGALDLTPVSLTQIVYDLKSTEDNKVYMFER